MTTLHPLLTSRWSPRAFDATHHLSPAEVDLLLEAARWAPSASNSQPWRFAVAHRGTPEHATLVEALVGWNQQWAPAAAVLLVAASVSVTADDKPLPWAAYDTGQAVAHLTVQAEAMGLVVHQMGGFDVDAVSALLDGAATPHTVIAIGRHDPSLALAESLATRETAPRSRHDAALLRLPLTTASVAASA